MMTILRTSRAPLGALLAASALAAPALTASPAAAAAPPLEREQRTYDRLYERVRDSGGRPGRHIVDDGIRVRGKARAARAHEVADAIRTLRRMTGQAAGPRGAAPAPAAAGASAGLEAIAACESGGDPAAVSANGTYRGKYQFDQGTWESVGGTGDPAAAPEAEQDARAAALAAQRGSSPWPNCG